jgi:hypothetical protein
MHPEMRTGRGSHFSERRRDESVTATSRPDNGLLHA